jgi:hypothetical protein
MRHAEHRSVPQIHRDLSGRGVEISERSVTNLLYRYEELVALRLSERAYLRVALARQGRVFWPSTACSLTRATRPCGSCETASPERYSWHAAF